MLNNGERQVAPTLSGIRRDHVARYEWAAKLLGSGKRVIDLACGVGYGAAVLADAGHTVTAIDRSPEAIEYAKKHYNSRDGVSHVVGDVSTLSLPETYDAAVCFETIEHIEDPLPMLRELCRTAPLLIASVPNEAVFPHEDRIRHHFRHYTSGQFRALLKEAGYDVTAWHGQAGPQSDVEPDIEGRTLIAVARRAETKSVDSEALFPNLLPRDVVLSSIRRYGASASPTPAPDHVAIVGLGPSGVQFFELIRGLGGASAYCDEVWGINAIGDTLRCDRIFHMDDVLVQEARAKAQPDGNIAAMVKWLKRHSGPIYTSVVREGYPGLVAFPLEEVLNRKMDTNGGAPYFNSTVAYAIAYAVHIGVKRISLFGVDFTYPNRHHAEKGRACCEFWLGIAAARGIEITVPDGTSMLDACEDAPKRLYGYDCVDVYLRTQDDGSVKVEMTPRETMPDADDVERAYDHSKHPNPLMRQD